ncbi:O-antigen ligase family protein [Winogradskyella sp. PAMC22761]|nr:O-antigen ligase family protein [Winogradskyella sp. PAMC22761]
MNSFKKFDKVIVFSYLSLAIFPLVRENVNSLFIIFCVFVTIVYKIINKEKFVFNWLLFVLTLPFWMFLIYNLVFPDFNIKIILLNSPFFIFPVLFYNRPKFIDKKLIKTSINIFQISLIIHLCISVFLYLKSNSFLDIFSVSNENIPFFRNFMYHYDFVIIHPTYFSSFLLTSATVSAIYMFKRSASKINELLRVMNIIICSFFIFLLSSKAIIIIYVLTILAFCIYIYKSLSKTLFRTVTLSVFALMFSLGFVFKNIILERFDEVITEYNKPIEGLYFNSTNIRMAILNCSLNLLSEVPFFGYGNSLQEGLNNCFSETYNSDFYKRSNYNTHNYYINIYLYGGFIFALLFLIYLFYNYIQIKHSKLALLFFFQLLIVNFTENFFSRHYGIVFFAYFISMHIEVSNNKEKKLINNKVINE